MGFCEGFFGAVRGGGCDSVSWRFFVRRGFLLLVGCRRFRLPGGLSSEARRANNGGVCAMGLCRIDHGHSVGRSGEIRRTHQCLPRELRPFRQCWLRLVPHSTWDLVFWRGFQSMEGFLIEDGVLWFPGLAQGSRKIGGIIFDASTKLD